MLTSYRMALRLPGSAAFASAGFVARLPIAIIGLGIVLMISTLTGSYAQAAVIAASFQVSAALGAVYSSRLADRLGQGRILVPLALVHAAGLVALVITIDLGWPVLVQAACAIVMGVAQPAIGSMVRARWSHAATDAGELRAGFALESVLDELIFTIGPLIAAALAFSVALPLPLLVSAALAVAGAWALALQHRSAPPAHPQRTHGGSALRVPGLVILAIASLGIGAVFGSYEVAVVAFTRAAGSPEASGLVLALWALGSMVGGVVYGARHLQIPLPRQAMWLSCIALVALIPAAFVHSVVWLAVVTLIGGFTVAPGLITVFALAQRLAPRQLLTECLTWVNSGMAIGYSAGNLMAGVVIDATGTAWAFRVPIVCSLATVVTFAVARTHLLKLAQTPD